MADDPKTAAALSAAAAMRDALHAFILDAETIASFEGAEDIEAATPECNAARAAIAEWDAANA